MGRIANANVGLGNIDDRVVFKSELPARRPLWVFRQRSDPGHVHQVVIANDVVLAILKDHVLRRIDNNVAGLDE